MKTDDLIAQMGTNLRPVSSAAPAWRIAGGLVVGAAAALAGIAMVAGTPFAAVAATGIATFTVKLSYSVAITVIAGVLLLGIGRPGRRHNWRTAWLLLPPLLIGVAAAMEMAGATAATRRALLLGTTWQTCLASIVVMSLPIFAALLWAFRRLAPTQLRLAGGLAGLTAGAAASIVYALYCPETAASFLIIWYTLGMALAASAGAIAGPRLLRW